MSLKSTLKSLKLHESTISMVLGALVIVVAGVILINYFSNRQGETVPPVEIEEVATEATTHVVQEGEDLWKISEQYYGTGFEWSKIAEANDISDPNQLEVGQSLTIPGTGSAEIAQAQPTEEPTTAQPSPTGVIEEEEATATPEPTATPTEAIAMEEPTEEEAQEAISGGEHTVASGESLWTIAERYYNSGYNWVDIANENNLENPGYIEEGQKLTIPSVEPKVATAGTEEPVLTSEAISGESYTVVPGDSLWTIALRAYGDGNRWPEIANENNLENPGLIHPGNELNLPR